ncbi:MAG: cation diffusion facilitator family transporter [Thermaerobacter sp.]|nr:cation diffusion facilitator family transporter [Thermaerobacter sp.]
MGDRENVARSARWGLVGNVALTAAKLAAGVLGNSRALVADGIHSAGDLASSVAVAVGWRMAHLPPDDDHNYGHAKAEAIAQKVVAVLLILTGFQIGRNAIYAFTHPARVLPGGLALAVAAGAMAIKWFMYRTQRATAQQAGSHALMASARDNLMDIVSSLIATLAILGARLGIPHIDALGALLVAGLVVWLGIDIFSQAAGDLMDRAADPALVVAIRQAAEAVEGVRAVNAIRSRMAGTVVLADLEIEVDARLSLLTAHGIAHGVEAAVLRVPRVAGVTVHVNPGADGRNDWGEHGGDPVLTLEED